MILELENIILKQVMVYWCWNVGKKVELMQMGLDNIFEVKFDIVFVVKLC